MPQDPEKSMIYTMLQFTHPTGPGIELQPQFRMRHVIGREVCSDFITFDANHMQENQSSFIYF